MNRGRLAIFSPDGPIQSYVIEKDTIAIGRSPGNDLVLERHGISRYHANLTVFERTAEIIDLDSVNGTYVDGLRLQPDEGRTLRGGEEIQIGDLRLVFHSPSSDERDATIQTSLQSADTAHLAVELEGPNIAVTPGTHAPATLILKNKTDAPLRVNLEVEGVPVAWARLDRNEFELKPNQQREIGINFKPARRPTTKPKTYPVSIVISFPEEDLQRIELATRLQVEQYNGYGVVMGTPILEDGGIFKVYVHNQGNGELPLRFSGADREGILHYDISPTQIHLSPGERATITGTVSSRKRRSVGQADLYEFNILSQSLTPAAFTAPVSARIRIKPAVENITRPALLGVMTIALALIMAALLITILNEGDNVAAETLPPPSITSFTANGEADMLTTNVNAPVLVSWEVQDADIVRLIAEKANGTSLTYTLDANTPNGYIIRLPEVGPYDLSLIAENRDQVTTTDSSILINALPDVNLRAGVRQTGNADDIGYELYRNVVDQRLIIEWETIWQPNFDTDQSLRMIVSSLDNPQISMDREVGVRGNLDMNIGVDNILRTISPIQISLVGEGLPETTYWVPVVYPECEVINTLDVYDTPSTDRILLTLSPTDFIRIDGWNQGGWLRILLPQGQETLGYWGWIAPTMLTNLDCPIEVNRVGLVGN